MIKLLYIDANKMESVLRGHPEEPTPLERQLIDVNLIIKVLIFIPEEWTPLL